MKAFRFWNLGLILVTLVWTIVLFLFFDHPLALIEKQCLFIPVGFGGAVLGNISAVGGGIIFIPAMMFLFHLAPVLSLKVALGSQSLGMTSGAVAWLQRRKLPFEVFKITVPGLLIGSFISSFVIHPQPILIKLFFGPVSILLGITTLVLIKKSASKGIQTYEEIKSRAQVPLFLVSILGGLVTGWIAIGEGELISSLLMLAYGMEASLCIGIGVVLLSINSIFLTLIHHFLLDGIPWEIVMFTGIGCIYGARFAIFLSNFAKDKTLKTIFAVIAICDGLLFIFQYLAK